MKQTAYILPVLLLSLLLGAGCSDSKTETQLVGIWEVYESTNSDAIGGKINFYEDSTAIMKTVDGFSAIKVQYKLEKNTLSLFSLKDKEMSHPLDSAAVKIKDNKLSLKANENGYIFSAKLDLRKISH